ncbi:MAG: adenylosuccinate lyase [Candidatus Sumerlaeia bacterium]|nr:adenylosuccinate lyase [Candidatus Sumerlaeia bacterium]
MIDRYALSPMKDLWSEEAKFQSWLDVELAVCDYYGEKGRIPAEDLQAIHEKSRINVARIEEIEDVVRHDVIAFTTQLAEEIGPASRFVHMGLTSSDVVDTAQALRVKRAGELIQKDIEAMIEALRKLALKHAHTPMMGRTHGMHAEPTTMGLKALVWFEEFKRHRIRFAAALEDISVGKISGAVGTLAHTELELEESVCARLGLKPAPVSTQVLQRDRHAAFCTTAALVAASIEKIATEIRVLQRPEIRELEEPFRAGQKGSSAMPHKRNPVQCEQLTGLARIVRGNVIPALENVALWGERDISHSSVERVILADNCILLDYMLQKMTKIIENLTVNTERMAKNLMVTKGLIFSQKMLLYLVDQGLTREDAYAAVQGAAMRCWHGERTFAEELMEEPAINSRFTLPQLEATFDVQPYLRHVKALFNRCGLVLE